MTAVFQKSCFLKEQSPNIHLFQKRCLPRQLFPERNVSQKSCFPKEGFPSPKRKSFPRKLCPNIPVLGFPIYKKLSPRRAVSHKIPKRRVSKSQDKCFPRKLFPNRSFLQDNCFQKELFPNISVSYYNCLIRPLPPICSPPFPPWNFFLLKHYCSHRNKFSCFWQKAISTRQPYKFALFELSSRF